MSARGFLCYAWLVPLLMACVSNAAETNLSHQVAAPQRPILDWRYVESENYRTYVANLHAIGCPKQTIRDIVTADVVSVFAPRRNEALKIRYQNYQYWKVDSSETDARAALNSQRRALDDEMNRVLKGLLGDDAPLPDVSREWQSAELDFKLAFLPSDKQAPVKAILVEHDHTDLQAKQLCDGNNVSEDTNELKTIIDAHDQGRAALRSLLTSEQFDLVEMNASWTGENLRHALVHFVPNEEEFRLIFAAWRDRDEQLAHLKAVRESDPDVGKDPVADKLKTQLSAERFKAYQDTWWN